jgi:hypothetical protein
MGVYLKYGIPTFALLTAAAGMHFPAVSAAEDLKLKEGISFSQDLDNGFPIVAEKPDDFVLGTDRPTFIFFGAAGDLNTNRQAKRIVDLYRKNRSTKLKFLVVDVDHAVSSECLKLLKDYYRGYIPFQILLNKSGDKAWSQTGEVDNRLMQIQLDRVLD